MSSAGLRSVDAIPGTPREKAVAGMGDALDRGATLRPDGVGRGHGRGPGVVPNPSSATVVVRAADRRLVSDLALEDQSADSARQRVDAVGLLRGEPDGTASARSTTGARDCAGWRVDSVHVNVRRPYPWYRTAFSIAAEALTMAATGLVYLELGGPPRPVEFAPLAGPLIAAISTYFFINTGLIAVAIALTSDRSVREVWLEDFPGAAPASWWRGPPGPLPRS